MKHDDSFVFMRTTKGIRKPKVRFHLPTGRQVELLSLHIEPGCQFYGKSPRPIFEEVAKRLFPHDAPVWIATPNEVAGDGFVCLAYFCSDTPAKEAATANSSYLLVGSFIRSISNNIQGLASELLAAVDWDASAKDDFLW